MWYPGWNEVTLASAVRRCCAIDCQINAPSKHKSNLGGMRMFGQFHILVELHKENLVRFTL